MRPKDIKNLDHLKSYYRTYFQFGSVKYLDALNRVDLMLFSKAENLTELKEFWIRLHKSIKSKMIHERSIGQYEIARFRFCILNVLSRLNPYVSSLLQREINQRKMNETA